MRRAETLRRDLAAEREVWTRRNTAYSGRLRRRVVGWVREAQASGKRPGEMERALGVGWGTLARWLSASRKSVELVQVAVEPRNVPSDPLAMVTPGGYRVEGLTLVEVVKLLEHLP